MRRVAMLLGAVGVVALGLAGSPAQAQQAGWGYYGSQSRATAWREHEAREWAWRRHEWREHHYRPAYWRPWYSHYGY